MHLLLSDECFVKGRLLTSVHVYIYSGDATCLDISRLLMGYQLHHGGYASCTDQIYYTCNSHKQYILRQKLQ